MTSSFVKFIAGFKVKAFDKFSANNADFSTSLFAQEPSFRRKWRLEHKWPFQRYTYFPQGIVRCRNSVLVRGVFNVFILYVFESAFDLFDQSIELVFVNAVTGGLLFLSSY